jgi:glyoxylase-like metal-dependent hydrolase (beta-lactamase superfamily II)
MLPGRTWWGLGAVVLLLVTVGVHAQQALLDNPGRLRVTHVRAGLYLITGAGGNVVAQTGNDGVLLVDAGQASASADVLDAVRQITKGPIRYIVNTGLDSDHIGGNETLRLSGATFTGGNATAVRGVDVGAAIVAHENLLHRVSGSIGAQVLPIAAWPTDTFFVPAHDLFFNGEPVELLHVPGAGSDSNVMVHFRRADVLVTGDVYRMDSYPAIDLAAGGNIQGTIDALNLVIAITVPEILQEGGTVVLPGHGRISDESEVVWYRDMVTIIRDRVVALIAEGLTLRQIQVSRPGLDYDWRWGSGPVSSDEFIETIYRSLRLDGL